MATPTSEGDMLSGKAKSAESKASVDYGNPEEQSLTAEEEKLAGPKEKIVPANENFRNKSDGRKHLMKVVSSVGKKEGGGKLSLTDTRSWEQKVDEAYTELIISLQEAWETHVLKIRSQLRNMVAQPLPKGTLDNDWKKGMFKADPAKGSTKEHKSHLILLLTVSVALLGMCVFNNMRIEGLRNELTVINQEYNFLQEKIGAMMEKMEMLPETIRKQNQPLVEEMRKEIRYALEMRARETRKI